jgi:hypothetical protein
MIVPLVPIELFAPASANVPTLNTPAPTVVVPP